MANEFIRLTRQDFARISNDPKIIRALEWLFSQVESAAPEAVDSTDIQTGISLQQSLQALSRIAKLAKLVENLPWPNIIDTPTTLAGYGITDAQPLSAVLTSLTGASADGVSLVTAADFAAMLTLLGIQIGVNVQAWDGFLDQISALSDPGADKILYWDNSTNQFTWLTVGANLTITGNTLDASGGGSGTTEDIVRYGDGSDSDFTAASGTTTLTRDMYYDNIIPPNGSTARIVVAGFRIFVKDTLNLTYAPANFITHSATYGTAAATIGGGQLGTAGGTGRTGSAGNGGDAASPTTPTVSNGGGPASGGIGGVAPSRSGGASPTQTVPPSLSIKRAAVDLIRGTTLINGGLAGSGGGGGALNSVAAGSGAGGNGGAGGDGAGNVFISAKNVIVASTASAGAISAVGANGTNGTNATATGGWATGGGGGGKPGGGGWIYFLYENLTGTKTGLFLASGGTGGNGGNGAGLGSAAQGADGASGGRVTIVDMSTATITETVGTGGSARSGTTGGAGETLSVNL